MIGNLRSTREPLYLNGAELEEILRWKLRSQFGRRKARREGNTDDVVQAVTRVALSIEHSNPAYEMELRVGMLSALRGVGVPVASAVLALAFPDHYCVVDFRGWRQVFGEKKATF